MRINIEPNLHLNNDNVKISCPNTRIFPQSMKTRQHCCSEVGFVFHMQEFDSVVPRIDEHIDTTAKRVFPHLCTDKAAEGVKALTHIGRLRPEPISETVVQAKHCPRWCEASPR